VQKPRSMIVGCPKLAQLTIQVDQYFENRGFEFCVFNEAIEPREIIHHDAANSFTVIWDGRAYRKTPDAHPGAQFCFGELVATRVTKLGLHRKTIAG
jgi:hypothetical protein